MITNCFHIGIVCSIETNSDWQCNSGGLGGGENLGLASYILWALSCHVNTHDYTLHTMSEQPKQEWNLDKKSMQVVYS